MASDNGSAEVRSNGNGKERLTLGVGYQGYSLDVGLERAASLFREKYGRAPAQVATAGSIILAGPVGTTPQGGANGGGRSLTSRAEAASEALTAEDARQLALELGA